MRRLLFAVCLVALAFTASSQTFRDRYQMGAGDPFGSCNTLQDGIYVNHTSGQRFICEADVWEPKLLSIDATTGNLPVDRLNSGTAASSSTFWRGDGTWAAPGAGGLPAGAIILIISGSCPAGFTEVSALAGKFVLGTTNGAGDIGTTGGSDTITSVINHTHTFSTVLRTATTGSDTTYVTEASDTSSTKDSVKATDNPAGGVASIDNRPAFVKVIFCSAD